MAASTTPAVAEQTTQTSPSVSVPFDFAQPPIIEGFSPLPRVKDETFKEKFIRKTKENPFVPIGQLHKQGNATKLASIDIYTIFFLPIHIKVTVVEISSCFYVTLRLIALQGLI